MANDTDIFGPASTTGPVIKDADIFTTPQPITPPKMSVLPTMRDSLRAEVAGRPGAAALAGFGTVLDNAALRLKQLVAPAPAPTLTQLVTGENPSNLSPQDLARIQANRDLIAVSPWARGGNIAGNAAVFGPMAGPGVLANAAVGAGAGFFGEPVMQGESGVGNAAWGGLFGGIGGAVGNLVTGAPVVARTPQVNQLLANDVVPTIGQAASSSPSRVAQAMGRAEEKAMSIPFVGDIIGNSRRRAVEEFNRAAITRAMPPGQAAQQIGEDGVTAARQALGAAYDNIYQNHIIRSDPRFIADLATARTSTNVPLSQNGLTQFDAIIQRQLQRFPANGLPAREAKMSIEADLGAAARDLMAPGSTAEERAVGQAVRNARDAFRSLMARNLPPGQAAGLPPLNQGYANSQVLRQTAERARAQGGVFTPFQLQTAARPGTPMREFANAGQAVLGGRVPNSGTTDRALIAGMLSPAAAGYYFGMPMLGALGAAPAAYSRTGARWLLGDVTNPAIQGLSPYIAQGLRQFEEQENKGAAR